MTAMAHAPREPLRCADSACAEKRCGHAHCDRCGACVSLESGHKFKDHASWREWHISRLCQACQDDVFQGEVD